jgi:very-short-patch-repair endonuclease
MHRQRGQSTTPVDVAIAQRAGAQFGVVSRRDLVELGVTKKEIETRITRGGLHVIHRGVYAVGHRVLSFEGRVFAAVAAAGCGAAASHRTGVALWGLVDWQPEVVEVTSLTGAGRSDASLRIHRCRDLHPDDVTIHRGIRVTTLSRSLIDFAGGASRRQVERALSQASLKELYDAAEMDGSLARSNGRHGARLVRSLVGAGVTRTRSSYERRLLAILRKHSLPRPRINEQVNGYEVDFHWPEARLIVEIDSRTFHLTKRAFEEDRRRDADLLLMGWRVLRVTERRLYEEPGAIGALIASALRASR